MKVNKETKIPREWNHVKKKNMKMGMKQERKKEGKIFSVRKSKQERTRRKERD